jgi:hypothetical protein
MMNTKNDNHRTHNPEVEGGDFFRNIFYHTLWYQQMEPEFTYTVWWIFGYHLPVSRCHFCACCFTIYPTTLDSGNWYYTEYIHHLLLHDLGIHHQSKHRVITIDALLAHLIAITVSKSVHTQSTMFNFMLFTNLDALWKMLYFDWHHLEPAKQNPR